MESCFKARKHLKIKQELSIHIAWNEKQTDMHDSVVISAKYQRYLDEFVEFLKPFQTMCAGIWDRFQALSKDLGFSSHRYALYIRSRITPGQRHATVRDENRKYVS